MHLSLSKKLSFFAIFVLMRKILFNNLFSSKGEKVVERWQMGKIIKNVISLRGKKHRKERASERECVCVCLRERAREECVLVCECKSTCVFESKSECVCVCV